MVGITFQAVANKYQWKITPKKTIIILFFIFAVLENYLWPLAFTADVTITVRNEAIASLLEIPPDYPLINLFQLGLFDLFLWMIQAALAGVIGSLMLRPQESKEMTNG